MLAAMLSLVGAPAMPEPLLAQSTAATPAAAAPAVGASTGLALPRFVSLKSDRVNLRQGPGTEYPTSWVYRRPGLPLEVIREHDGWRQVRDAESATGWVLQTALSGRRTALVTPWEAKPGRPVPQVPLWADDRDGSAVVANVEAGVIANIRTCNGRWCHVSIGEFKGYIEQFRLWGVYEGEIVK
jgi:SH3-like domain-containing protein